MIEPLISEIPEPPRRPRRTPLPPPQMVNRLALVCGVILLLSAGLLPTQSPVLVASGMYLLGYATKRAGDSSRY